MAAADELQHERSYLAALYGIIDARRQEAEAVLADALRNRSTGFASIFERDRLSEAIGHRLRHLETGSNGLCFGKLVEAETHASRYIGRLAVEDDHHEPLLVDWRAPIAEPFYRATALNPMGMSLRRHLIMSGRTLLNIEDDLLSADAVSETEEASLVGEAALLMALNRERTGQMDDIVATIQRDQDEIIRAPMRSTLVVTGGPGTGKTVVALHRAAYLLYTHRTRIENNGVLIVGPSSLFLRYIERVLPSLGESSVVLLDWSELLPGIAVVPDTDPDVAELKGSLRMAEVLRRAVRLVERAPQAGVQVIDPDGKPFTLSMSRLQAFRRTARKDGRAHNEGRGGFERLMRRETDANATGDALHRDSSRHSVRRAADRLWPVLTPTELLNLLLCNHRILAAASGDLLDERECALLRRSEDDPWTVSDLPLLDELRVLLGEVPAVVERRPSQELLDAVEYARAMIDEFIPESEGRAHLEIPGLVNLEQLVERFAEQRHRASLAEQVRRDPSWKFAHIVVDEAQDVTPMQWRALDRRCQRKSMTIVGDPDQTMRPSTTPWIERITDALGIDECDERSLHVNYRTPAAIVEPARELRAQRTEQESVLRTRYVREGNTPWTLHTSGIDRASVGAAIDRARQELGDRGRLAVISSARHADLVAEVVQARVGDAPGTGAARLTRPVASYLAAEVKGLEFDSVVVVDPAAIEEECGWRQLYVVLTRPTRHLGTVTVGDDGAVGWAPAVGHP